MLIIGKALLYTTIYILLLIIFRWCIINIKEYKQYENELLRLNDGVIIYLKKKIKEIIRNIILIIKKFFVFAAIFIFLTIILKNYNTTISKMTEWFGKYGIIILSLMYYIYAAMLTTIFIAFVNKYQEFLTNRFYSKQPKTRNKLFFWLAEDTVSKSTLFDLFKEDSTGNDIKNTKKISDILKSNLNYDVAQYKLYRNHLEYKTKKSFFKKLNLLILTSISSYISLNILPKFYKNVTEGIVESIESSWLWIDSDVFLFIFNIVIYISMIFIIYFTLYHTLLMLTDNSRRVQYLISILDILIEEESKGD
ncbi:hypothetical protein [Lysinibacillus varians]|uniref:Uncharacterized protein n=1 Tax=Lysinibacillus varians TaxID=1145276 RepID=A0ABY2T470_9BACI|nr:hypothetical protein [Lysinibacillus varians]AHN24274.1 hypothetical protein T479_12720 [Lysinibacillus varians]TKI51333.1 hypothetical protein FC752_22090 [Lysinibacillus varians]